MAVALVKSAETADSEAFAVDGRAALETRLAQALVQTFAQRTARYFRMEFAS